MSNVVDTRRDTSALTWIQSTTDFNAEASVGSIRPDLALASVSQPAVPEGTEIDTVLLIVAFAIPNLQSFNNLQAASGFPPWIWGHQKPGTRKLPMGWKNLGTIEFGL